VPDKGDGRINMRKGTHILFPNWVKSVRSLILIRNNENSGTIGTCATSISKDPNLLNACLTSMTNVLALPTRLQTISFLGVEHITA